MSDILGPPPPPDGEGGYPPPGWLPPPPAGAYQQQGYGYIPGEPPTYAGFWIRFGALLIDSVLVNFVGQALISVASAGSEALGLVMFFAVLVGNVLYYAILEGGPTGQTVGKRICNIRVVDVDTLQPGIGIGRGVGRYFARIISALVFGLGYFWMLWDDKNQCWHDKMVRDLVVRVKA